MELLLFARVRGVLIVSLYSLYIHSSTFCIYIHLNQTQQPHLHRRIVDRIVAAAATLEPRPSEAALGSRSKRKKQFKKCTLKSSTRHTRAHAAPGTRVAMPRERRHVLNDARALTRALDAFDTKRNAAHRTEERWCSNDENAAHIVASLENDARTLSVSLARRDAALADTERELATARARAKGAELELEQTRDALVDAERAVDSARVDAERERSSAIEATEALVCAIADAESCARALAEAQGTIAALERANAKASVARDEAVERANAECEARAALRIERIERRARAAEAEAHDALERLRRRDANARAASETSSEEAAALRETVSALELDAQRAARREDALEEKLARVYDSNASLKAMAEKANERARAELKKNAALHDRITTLERRVSDMRRDHVDAEMDLKRRVEESLMKVRAANDDARAEAKQKFEFKAQLEDALAKLKAAEEREAHARESLTSMVTSKELIYKAYVELLEQTQEAERRAMASQRQPLASVP